MLTITHKLKTLRALFGVDCVLKKLTTSGRSLMFGAHLHPHGRTDFLHHLDKVHGLTRVPLGHNYNPALQWHLQSTAHRNVRKRIWGTNTSDTNVLIVDQIHPELTVWFYISIYPYVTMHQYGHRPPEHKNFQIYGNSRDMLRLHSISQWRQLVARVWLVVLILMQHYRP